jgi:hypothetical protein
MRCFRCNALVEHNQGCRHMTCLCKAQFCYVCGLKWQTCECDDNQLERAQTLAQVRRQQQRERQTAEQAATVREAERAARAAAREAALAAENEQIIAEVEAFIGLEAEREAREIETERRIREEERRWREEEHIVQVHERFLALNNELSLLHDVQRILMEDRYEHESQTSKLNLLNALDSLAVKHVEEERSLALETERRMADAEAALELEYSYRRSEAQKREDQYVSELEQFYAGVPNAEYQIQFRRDLVRAEFADDCRVWEDDQRSNLRASREVEDKKVEVLKAKQMQDVLRVKEGARVEADKWRVRKEAEIRWREEVFPERERMLSAMEMDEYASEVQLMGMRGLA